MRRIEYNPGDVVYVVVTGHNADNYIVATPTGEAGLLDAQSIPEEVKSKLEAIWYRIGYHLEVIVTGRHEDTDQLVVSMLDSTYKEFGKSKGYQYSPGDVVDAKVIHHVGMHHVIEMPTGEPAWLEVVCLPEDVERRPGDQVYPVGSTIEVIVVYRDKIDNQLKVSMLDSDFEKYGKKKKSK